VTVSEGYVTLEFGEHWVVRILIADDNRTIRKGIRTLLSQHENWEVCGEAVDGQETIDKARQLCPDVIVLDFFMPVINGIDAAKEISRMRPKPGILLCSMYLDGQLAHLANNAGITAVISKSNVGQVVQGVEAVLRGEEFVASQI
jgi:DNA-binding NarL/FixJ family response regulator